MPLNNFGVIDPVFEVPGVITGAWPFLLRSAQPEPPAFGWLRLIMGRPFVTYRLSNADEGPVSLDQETEVMSARGMGRIVHDPRLGNGMNPSIEVVRAVASDVNNIYAGGEAVLIHCLHGEERTGAVSAFWRLEFGEASLAAVEADLALYGITGLTRIADFLILDAVRDFAKQLGK
jgi:hypothetical protein